MLLIKNSPINERRKSSKQLSASGMELEIARIIVLLHRYGPTPECRSDAIRMFPHLFPKSAVLRTLNGQIDDQIPEDAISKVVNDLLQTEYRPSLLTEDGQPRSVDKEGKVASSTGREDGGSSASDNEMDLWSTMADEQTLMDDGTRPTDAEYNRMRGFQNYNFGKSSSASDREPYFSFEVSRRGVEHYFKHSIARSRTMYGTYDTMMRKIKNEQLRMAESGRGDEKASVNALGTTNSASTLSAESLERYWPKDKDEDADPRPQPSGFNDTASGWAHYGLGGNTIRSYSPKSIANVMWPKHMPMLANPMRTWKQSNPRYHAENVKKWNGKSSV